MTALRLWCCGLGRVSGKSRGRVRFVLSSFLLFLQNLALLSGFEQQCQPERLLIEVQKKGTTCNYAPGRNDA